MNKTEYYSCGNNTQNKYWRYTQKLLKEWMAKNNITEPCVVHHIDNEPNAIKYNNEHYELWGHEIDKNGNLKFELGKYVQFMTRVEHSRYHNTGEKNHHYGLHLSEDHKNKISNAMKNGNSPWYGKQLSEEHKKKLSLSHMGKTLTPEQRAKISAANKGRVVSQETRKKMSDATFNRIYQSKDIYLAFAHEMGMVNDNDWNTMSVDELKSKYKQVRSMIKPMILGLSYGMGAEKLSESIKISVARAKYYRDMINKTIQKTTNYKSGLKEFMDNRSSRALSLPDGFVCQYNPNDVNSTTLTNWPFQSSGSMILRHLVKTIMKAIRSNELNIKMVATIHDVIAFECNENDYETIDKVRQMMIDCANYILSAKKGRDWSIKVGEPEIIKHNDIWASGDDTKAEQFKSWLEYNVSE